MSYVVIKMDTHHANRHVANTVEEAIEIGDRLVAERIGVIFVAAPDGSNKVRLEEFKIQAKKRA